MKWLGVTAALLAASAALVVGIYLRDWSSAWRLPPQKAAEVDARRVLTFMAGPQCGRRCSYRMLAHPRTNHWLAVIVDRARPPQCVDINVDRFEISAAHGVSGVQPVSCDSAAAAANS
jgi:hypothetical protein